MAMTRRVIPAALTRISTFPNLFDGFLITTSEYSRPLHPVSVPDSAAQELLPFSFVVSVIGAPHTYNISSGSG